MKEDIKILLDKKTLNKAEGITLANWYLETTGKDERSCMCSYYQRKQIQNKIKKYLENNE